MTYQSLILSKSPLCYWRLGETSGTNANDETANNRDGTYNSTRTLNQTSLILSSADPSVLMNGGQVIGTGGIYTSNSQRTFEVWLKRTDTTHTDVIFGSPDVPGAVLQFVISSDNVTFQSNTGSATVTWANAITAGVVHHVVLTYDDSTKVAHLWVDGVDLGAKTCPSQYPAGGPFFSLGGYNFSGLFHGNFDELAIYGSILSSASIQENYAAGLGITVVGSQASTTDSGQAGAPAVVVQGSTAVTESEAASSGVVSQPALPALMGIHEHQAANIVVTVFGSQAVETDTPFPNRTVFGSQAVETDTGVASTSPVLTSDIRTWITQPGGVYTVPNGTYTAGQLSNAAHAAGSGKVVLVAQTQGGVIIDQSPVGTALGGGLTANGNLVLDGTTSHVLLVGFKFIKGRVSLSGDGINLWYCEHTWPYTDWFAESTHPSDRDGPRTVFLDQTSSRCGIFGGNIHGTGTGIYVNNGARNVEIIGTDISALDNGGNYSVVHPDCITMNSFIHPFYVDQCYLHPGSVTSNTGMNIEDNLSGKVYNGVLRRTWITGCGGMGLQTASGNTTPSHQGVYVDCFDVHIWGNGVLQASVDRPFWQFVEYVDGAQINYTFGSNPQPTRVNITADPKCDLNVAQSGTDPASVWRAAHPYASWSTYHFTSDLPNTDYDRDQRAWLALTVGPGNQIPGGAAYMPPGAYCTGIVAAAGNTHVVNAAAPRNGWLINTPWQHDTVIIDGRPTSCRTGGNPHWTLDQPEGGGGLVFGGEYGDSTAVGTYRVVLDDLDLWYGSFVLSGVDRFVLWNCRRTFPIQEWKRQFDAACTRAGRAVRTNDIPADQPQTSNGFVSGPYWSVNIGPYMKHNSLPTGVRLQRAGTLANPGGGAYCSNIGVWRTDIYECGDDGVFLGQNHDVKINGTRIWKIDQRGCNDAGVGQVYYGPGPDAWFHNDSIQWRGEEHDIDVFDTLLAEHVEFTAEDPGNIDYVQIGRVDQCFSEGVGMEIGAISGRTLGPHGFVGGDQPYRWFANGRTTTDPFPNRAFYSQDIIDGGGNAGTIPRTAVFNVPTGVTLDANGHITDIKQVVDHVELYVNIWRAANAATDRDAVLTAAGTYT